MTIRRFCNLCDTQLTGDAEYYTLEIRLDFNHENRLTYPYSVGNRDRAYIGNRTVEMNTSEDMVCRPCAVKFVKLREEIRECAESHED